MAERRLPFFIHVTALAVLLMVAYYRLSDVPLTWFDEGSHLHVPKALVLYGEYADYSSEGFRYDGPVVGVGPTVMLPIALMFKLFGIGLLQARVVPATYLVATVILFYLSAKKLGAPVFAFAASGLLVFTRTTGFLDYGRQVLGEVPGFFYLILGVYFWFRSWNQTGSKHLIVVGVAFGLAMVTKVQYVIVIIPALLLALIARVVYYKSLKTRVILTPLLVAGAVFFSWQLILFFFIQPGAAYGSLANVRASTEGAALVFSPELMKRSVLELLSWKTFIGAFIPSLLFGGTLIVADDSDGQRWFILLAMVSTNLVWYVVASVSWVRYAFPSLALMSLFVAKFFEVVGGGIQWPGHDIKQAILRRVSLEPKTIRGLVTVIWLALAILYPMLYTFNWIHTPPINTPEQMAAFMNGNIPEDAVIETWEPEMGFLTDHRYHFPPNSLLDRAVRHIWLDGPSPSQVYDQFPDEDEYLLTGKFSQWVNLYDLSESESEISLITQIGPYRLYQVGQALPD